MEAAWAVAYAEGYNGIFKLAKTQCECGFPFITFPYLKAVKGGDNIELGIDFGLAKPLKSLTYKRYRVLVLDYNSVKSSIVNAELNTSSWLLSKEDRGGCWGYAGINKPFVEVLVDILFNN